MREQSNVPNANRPQAYGGAAFGNRKLRTIRAGALVVAVAAIASLLFYGYLHFSETGRLPTLQKDVRGFISALTIGITTGVALFRLNKVLDRWLPWTEYFTSRFLSGFISNVAITIALVSGLSTLIAKLSGFDVFSFADAGAEPDVLWKIIILSVVFMFIYNVIYALLYSYQHYAVAQINQLMRDRKQLELQFEALKSQISPHYLFNSLNTISSLLFKDIQSAEQFIRRLAQTYQYVLSTQNKKYVSLREELDFVQSYYYLLRIRFHQQLNVEINVPSRILDTRIPPLTLQMLIENAVKHNTFTGDKKLFIYIMAQDNTYLKVINTKTGLLENVPSFKVGLENIRQRYHFLTDKQVVVEDADKFVVSLPVLERWEETDDKKNSA